MYIGKKIRELRKEKKMKLIEMARITGIQIATLSRMENEKMVGTLSTHMKIAKALEVDITALYSKLSEEEEEPDIYTKSGSDIYSYSDKSSFEMLTNRVLTKKMMPVLLTIEVGGDTNTEENKAGTEKFIFVLEGTIDVVVGEDRITLTQNNTLYFNANLEHKFINTGTTTAKAIVTVTPVAL